MSGAWPNCSPTSSLLLLGLNRADQGLRENDRSLILSRRGGPECVSERGSCAPSPDSGVLPAHMPTFKQLGATHLAMEMIRDDQQEIVDAFLSQDYVESGQAFIR